MNYLQKIIVSLSVLIGLSVPVLAEAQRGREFSCLSLGAMPAQEIFYETSEGMKPIVTLAKRRSEPEALTGAGFFKLFIKKEKSDGSMGYQVIGETSVPEKTKTVLFILSLADEGAKLPVRILALDDSLEAFPKGTFRFVNFTKETFGIEFGGLKKVVKSKSLTLMKIKMKPKGGFMQMTMFNTKGEPVFGKKLFGQPNNRFIAFITPSDNPKRRLNIVTTQQAVTAMNR